MPDGPLYLRGDIEISASDGTVLLNDTRVALCRCGASSNKPLCDNSHEEFDFDASGTISGDSATDGSSETDGVLRVTLTPDGPLYVEDSFELRGLDGGSKQCDGEAALCRCGSSEDKPLCDGTHEEIGFISDRPSE